MALPVAKPAPHQQDSPDTIEVGRRRGPTSKFVPVGDNPKFEVDRLAGKVRYVSNRRPVTDPAILAALIPPPKGVFVALGCCRQVARDDHLGAGAMHWRAHLGRLVRERPLHGQRERHVPPPSHLTHEPIGRRHALRTHISDTASWGSAAEFIPLLGMNESPAELKWRETHVRDS